MSNEDNARTVFAALAAPESGWTQESTTLLDQGIYAEETVGDLDAAIGIYERILLNAEANRVYAAQAQYRLGVCYAKMGREGDASAAFQKVIDRYADYKEVVGLIRVRLNHIEERIMSA